MLNELSHYENLGTPKYFWELFSQLKNDKERWTMGSIREYFFNRIIDGKTVFDGCLFFADSIGAIKIENGNSVLLDPSVVGFLRNERYLGNKLLEMLFDVLKNEDSFHEIFCSQNISYDIVYRSIQIKNGSFCFKHANFKQFLIDFHFLYPHPDKNINRLIINPGFRKFFEKNIIPEIKKRKIGIDEFQKSLEQKQIYGDEAEDFVLNFEKERLGPHVGNKVEKISDYDVTAGYDIVSFDSIDSSIPDRFIEVKSFTGEPNFFWSRNEVDIAKIKKNYYFLYLVDRNKINQKNYTPMIIQDPHDCVLNNDLIWIKRTEKYFLKKIS